MSGSIGRWRQGAVRIYERPSEGPNGKAAEPFPTTTESRPEVQSALLADLGAERTVVRLPIAVKLEFAQIKNANNQPAAAALYVRAILSASYAFRYP